MDVIRSKTTVYPVCEKCVFSVNVLCDVTVILDGSLWWQDVIPREGKREGIWGVAGCVQFSMGKRRRGALGWVGCHGQGGVFF